MLQIFIKSVKITLWVLLPLFLISNIKFDESVPKTDPTAELYNLKASGNLNQNLSGTMIFETTTEAFSSERTFSILKLRLQSNQENVEHSMEFLISKENSFGDFPLGSYNIARDEDGFLNYYDGVFGFANIKDLGELPFFAQKGEINIEYVDQKMVKGSMNVSLRNANGENIELIGDFVASN